MTLLAIDPVSTAAATDSPAAVVTMLSPDEFSTLGPTWTALLRNSNVNNPFLAWEWLQSWWVHQQKDDALALIAVRAGGDLIALAPLRATRAATGFAQLEFLGTGHAGSDYLDVIARRGDEVEAVRAIGRWLAARQQTVRLSHLPTASLALELARQLIEQGWTCRQGHAGICPFIQLAGHTWDSYLATLGPAHRANVRRRVKGLHARFRVRFERAGTESQRRAMLDALIAFHDQRWGAASTAFTAPGLRPFHDNVTRRALASGSLRLFGLYLDDELAAVMYGFFCDRRFYFYQHGFDERFATHSVGLVLMGLTIQDAIAAGAIEFDLLFGTETYKACWARDRRVLGRIDLFPPTIGGWLHHRALQAELIVRRLVRRLRTGGRDAA